MLDPMDRQDIKRRKRISRELADTSAVLRDLLLAFITDVELALDVQLDRDVVTIKTGVQYEGFGFLSKRLPEFWRWFLDSVVAEKIINPLPRRFRAGAKADRPAFLQKLTNELFDDNGNLSIESRGITRCAKVVKAVNTICNSFGSKYEAPLPDDLQDAFLRELFDDDKNVALSIGRSILDLGKDAQRIVGEARSLLKELFQPYRKIGVEHGSYKNDILCDFWSLRPKFKFGPGAVTEGYCAYGKYYHLFECPPLEAIPRLELFEVPYPMVNCTNGLSPQTYTEEDVRRAANRGGPSVAKIVPKKCGVGRVIMLQPNDLMFLQKGYQARLYEWVESHPLTSGFVNFKDQGINGELALAGSKGKDLAIAGSLDGSWATLDLTKASNMVTKGDVGVLFDEKMASVLLGLTTHQMSATLTDGSELSSDMNMYAAMGSALCFPVEALVFWAICKAALLVAGLDDAVYVYGDDIIVRSEGYEVVAHALSSLGYVVNRSKSFSKGPFRESCGVDAFCGERVDPVFKISTRVPTGKYLTDSSELNKALVGWVEYANMAESAGYLFLAEAVRSVITAEVALARSFPQTGEISEVSQGFLAFYVDGFPSIWESTLKRKKADYVYVESRPHGRELVLRKIPSFMLYHYTKRDTLVPEVPPFKGAQGHFFGTQYQGLSRNLYTTKPQTEIHPRQSGDSHLLPDGTWEIDRITGRPVMPDGVAMLRWWTEGTENQARFATRDLFDVKRERISLS